VTKIEKRDAATGMCGVVIEGGVRLEAESVVMVHTLIYM
jgi:hypothetical protein